MKIQQVLCGYDDGHRILASSTDLPPESKRITLILSDMSGSYVSEGFNSYITGYPLPQITKYAFSKTWYAKEIKRPGCVWTHILLLDFSDLAKIKEIQIVTKLFSYPTNVIKNYNMPLLLEGVQNTPQDCSFSDKVVKSIIYSLYTAHDDPIFISSPNSEQYKDTVLHIWNQQWPKLRRNFCFCTGSLANRSLNGKPFDLQIVPASNVRSVQLEAKGSWIINNSLEDIDLTWLSTAIKDLSSASEARSFLFRYGSETNNGRAAFIPLLEVWELLDNIKNEKISLCNILSLFSQHFPTTKEVRQLKLDIFGYSKCKYAINKVSILTILSTTEHHQVFDVPMLNIQEQVKLAWEECKLESISLLVQLFDLNLNYIGEKILSIFIGLISIEDAIEIRKKNQNLIYELIKKRPTLALSSMVWEGNLDHKKQLFSILTTHESFSTEYWKNIVWIMLDSRVDFFAAKLSQNFPEITNESLLSWLTNNEQVEEPSTGWKKIIIQESDFFIKKLTKRIQIETIYILSSILNPNTLIIEDFDLWLYWGRQASEKLESEQFKEFTIFLLALGFQNFDMGGYKLVNHSFQKVYDYTKNSEIGNKSWTILYKHLPSSPFWQEWDRCEKLIRACAKKFLDCNSSAKYFFTTFDNVTLEKVLDYCNRTYKGKNFISLIKNL